MLYLNFKKRYNSIRSDLIEDSVKIEDIEPSVDTL